MRRTSLLALAWVLGLLGFFALLQRDAPLFLNLGPGDEAYARGFRDRWERDGKDSATIYRGSLDGARIEWPVEVAGRVRARLRLARHGSAPAEMSLTANGRIVETWTQPPQGWRLREFDLGFGCRPEAGAPGSSLSDRLENFGIGVTENHRTPGTDPVQVPAPVAVDHLGAFG